MTRLPFDPDLDAANGPDLTAESPFSSTARRRANPSLPPARSIVAVACGGLLGGCARYALDRLLPVSGDEIDWGTFAVNTVGAFLLALLLVVSLEVWAPLRLLRPFVAVGFLGSFTTFGTVMLEFDQLVSDGAFATAGLYLVMTVSAGLAATTLGLLLGRGVASRRTTQRIEEAG
ncbi:MAG: CrcB family protein [Nocardioidaceae bacterium]